jgi:pimeloyl-ACP methyl ester carboxylesterase
MAAFVLVPGAGGAAWYWHRVVPLLEKAKHEAIAVDLPGADEHAGLSAYADRVVESVGPRDVVLVAQSLGGFTAPYFLHDVPSKIVEQGETHQRPEADIVFGEPCRFDAWPEVPIHVIAGRDDRFFPIDFQRRVARERLRIAVDEIAGGHLLALSNPRGLVDQLLGYLRA